MFRRRGSTYTEHPDPVEHKYYDYDTTTDHDSDRIDDTVSERVEEHTVTTHPDPSEVARDWLHALALFTMFGLAVVQTLLAFRLIFQLAAANPASGFVDFIYDITGPIVEPFNDIGSVRRVGDGILDPATIVAMLVYFAAAMLFMALFGRLRLSPWEAARP